MGRIDARDVRERGAMITVARAVNSVMTGCMDVTLRTYPLGTVDPLMSRLVRTAHDGAVLHSLYRTRSVPEEAAEPPTTSLSPSKDLSGH